MTGSIELPGPAGNRDEVAQWVMDQLGDLCSGSHGPSPIRGGQRAADQALATFDVTGYARKRNNVHPTDRRGGSRLSPYLRHGLITLPEAHDRVSDGPHDDREKFRDELMWQEYARHLYARLGTETRLSLRFHVPSDGTPDSNPWDVELRCLQESWQELTETGYLTNQTRMWLASHWTVRHSWNWQIGEDLFFRHLLDGSRAANRSGWQWTVGALTGKPYGFSRWQVEKRARHFCSSCPVAGSCPIEEWPAVEPPERHSTPNPQLLHDQDPDATGGPKNSVVKGPSKAVWLTAESLGMRDPALVARPQLPVIFVFDETLLRRLRLAFHRIMFLAEALAELSESRELLIYRGSVVEVLSGIGPVAATFAPVPGWRRIRDRIDIAEVHPWPWLRYPHSGSVASFSAWSRAGKSRR